MKTILFAFLVFACGFITSTLMFERPDARLAFKFTDEGHISKVILFERYSKDGSISEMVFYTPTGAMRDLAPGVPDPPIKSWSDLQFFRFGKQKEDKIIALTEVNSRETYFIDSGRLVSVTGLKMKE